MHLSKIPSLTKKLVSDNSPVILTAIGVTGTITSVYLAVKATFKAAEVIQAEKEKPLGYIKPKHLTPFDNKTKFKLVWKLYVPTAVTCGMTCGCIIAANYIGTRRAAALATAYSLSEKAVAEYKTKVIEKMGEDSEKEVRDEIAQEHVTETAHKSEVLFVSGEVLCHDGPSGRYFMCDKETLRRAQNDVGYEILHSDYATLSFFYKKVGLEPTSTSDEFGWNSENPCELLFSTTETPDGRPCLSYDFSVVPVRNPWIFHA